MSVPNSECYNIINGMCCEQYNLVFFDSKIQITSKATSVSEAWPNISHNSGLTQEFNIEHPKLLYSKMVKKHKICHDASKVNQCSCPYSNIGIHEMKLHISKVKQNVDTKGTINPYLPPGVLCHIPHSQETPKHTPHNPQDQWMIKVRKQRVYTYCNCGKRDVGIHSIQHCEALTCPQITNLTRDQPVTTHNKFQNLYQENIKYIADTPQITKPQLIRRTRWDNSQITKAKIIVNQINNEYRDISHSSNTICITSYRGTTL